MTGEEKLFEVISWWEKRRWIYNLIVAVVGIAGISFFLSDWFVLMPGAFVYNIACFAVMANICYTSGWVVAIWKARRNNSTEIVGQYRRTLFMLGTAFTLFVELFYILITAAFNQ